MCAIASGFGIWLNVYQYRSGFVISQLAWLHVERWSFYFGVWLQYETWKCTYILNPVFNIIFPIGITMAFVLFYAIYKVCTYPSGPVVYIQMILFFRRLFIIYRFCSGPIQLSPFFNASLGFCYITFWVQQLRTFEVIFLNRFCHNFGILKMTTLYIDEP